jgi:hypothetical protein
VGSGERATVWPTHRPTLHNFGANSVTAVVGYGCFFVEFSWVKFVSCVGARVTDMKRLSHLSEKMETFAK